MKIIRVLAVAGLVSAFAAAASAEDVRIKLTGVEARGGEVLATLQTETEFMQSRGSYNARVPAPSSKGDVEVVFAGVAPARYALSVLHDENGDFQMARDADGKPLEGWAMTNASKLKAKPTFADVSVELGAKAATLTEPMIYPKK